MSASNSSRHDRPRRLPRGDAQMIYTEKSYIAAGQALARASTEQAAKARARIIRLMIDAEQPADRARARELVAEGEAEPP
jgi:hypothetical protein